jgi:peptidoglycan/LPS O-acetylase OafA/YrhL
VFPVIGEFSFRGHLPEVLALTLIFGVAIAAVSYALVESPCRETLRRWEKRRQDRAAPDRAAGERQEDAIAP